VARYLFFSLRQGQDPRRDLAALSQTLGGEQDVIGIGESLARALSADVAGLRTFPHHVGEGIDVPSTPLSLFCWLRGDDRGKLVHRARSIDGAIGGSFRLDQTIDGFMYSDSRDLTGYEDGTENPEDQAAVDAAILQGAGAGMDGSSFVAVQQWIHDLGLFETMPQHEQDNTIGRRKIDNEELEDAPESAHVKRTAQESFAPEAWVLRRSMPWSDAEREGLVFVAFGRSFDAFEAQLKRMTGAEDGITDALFKFTRPVLGAYFWCPPVRDGHLDLRAVGL
jgi:putative iron-dependent peroxidase